MLQRASTHALGMAVSAFARERRARVLCGGAAAAEAVTSDHRAACAPHTRLSTPATGRSRCGCRTLLDCDRMRARQNAFQSFEHMLSLVCMSSRDDADIQSHTSIHSTCIAFALTITPHLRIHARSFALLFFREYKHTDSNHCR